MQCSTSKSTGGASGKEPTCKCRRHKRLRFDPWVRKIPRRRAWQPTTVFLSGEPHGWRSLAGCGPQGHKESATTEQLTHPEYWTTADVQGLKWSGQARRVTEWSG